MLTIKNLTVSYKDNIDVIKNLSINFEESKIHGIAGLNGAGKTSLLNSIFGNIKPKSGEIEFQNKILTKKVIGYLETENFFYSNIKGNEYLSLFKGNLEHEKIWNSIFNLPLNDLIDSYSTGMKKKLALMSILKTEKPIYFFDEPFNGLDMETVQTLKIIIQKLREKGKTILITSHILESITSICDNIVFMEKGQIKYKFEKNEFQYIEKQIFNELNIEKNELINRIYNSNAIT